MPDCQEQQHADFLILEIRFKLSADVQRKMKAFEEGISKIIERQNSYINLFGTTIYIRKKEPQLYIYFVPLFNPNYLLLGEMFFFFTFNSLNSFFLKI